jgi:predicted CXXCH cytochrome family protein
MKEQPGRLCFSCHAEGEAKFSSYKFQHSPVAKLECNSCHSGHTSPHAAFLKTAQPVLCLSCHGDIAKFWQKGASHSPAAEDCTICHAAHGSNQPSLTVEAIGPLCAQCHDQETPEFLAAHQQIKPGPASCVSCHDPHGGPQKNLLYPVSHDPFKPGAPGSCTPCHKERAK